MNLISESYKAQNQQLHENPSYGVSGHKFAGVVAEMALSMGTKDILDYGCGKRTLEGALGIPIKNYDPCIPGLDAEPAPADLAGSASRPGMQGS